ncbi:arylamine N-acetyltransferase 4 [Polyplosphaeria fusca]|uniref:Arylamine N-acetyltransferase 4 n=1 Tax=Polyplosphaeria fusca TaxID=682080 RepID=A0A9P4V627_9PLEO|nr:arylamine N-acetyltransferase 4 [Polyplosphaeria fusca]
MSAYTPEQISAYCRYIELPERFHPENDAPRDLAFLTALHVHTISTIPYENLTLHYSKAHSISIEPEHLFQKVVVDKRGRGGYCMEVSILFNHILKGLSFNVYTAGVRIRLRENGVPAGEYTGWRHIVNIVTLEDGSKYVCDVGFGGDGATKPLPLKHPQEGIQNLGTQDIRLVHDHIPLQTVRTDSTKQWIYQYRNSPDLPWNSFYAFSEFEFFHDDFRVVNWYTGNSAESFQATTPMIVKFLRQKKQITELSNGVVGVYEGEEIYGKLMLVYGTVKQNLGGKTKIVHESKTERERIKSLWDHFGITLTAEEQDAIKGHLTELV